MGNVLTFVKPEIIKDEILEEYAELIEKLGILKFKHDLIIDNINTGKLFNGCHSPVGDISEKTYKSLLSFHNSPTFENWKEIRDVPVFSKWTPLDIVVIYHPHFLKKEDGIYPDCKMFLSCFNDFKEYILEKNEEYIKKYSDKIKQIEMENPHILKILKE